MTAPAVDQPAIDQIELRIALDLARHAAVVTPIVMVAVGLWRGFDATAAVALAVGLVVANWIVAALSLGWAARRSPNLLMAVALLGFIARLILITAIGAAIKAADIVDWPVFCATLLVAYGGLLVWELRYVSFSLASPGLKPKRVTSSRPSRGSAPYNRVSSRGDD